jgi:hypothetical protein
MYTAFTSVAEELYWTYNRNGHDDRHTHSSADQCENPLVMDGTCLRSLSGRVRHNLMKMRKKPPQAE